MQNTPLYTETQRFGQWWLRGLMLIVFGLSLWAFIWQIILGKPIGNDPASDTALIVLSALVGLGLPGFMLWLNLRTEVREDGIYVRFRPLHIGWVRIPREHITAFTACTYRPVRDYGGWGIRWGPKGKAYNVMGNRGVQLILQDGKRLLIGSQNEVEFEKAIAAMTGTTPAPLQR